MEKYCPRCGHKSAYKFCPKCGFSLQQIKVAEKKYCPQCGFKSDKDFCPKCGFNLKDINLEETNSSIPEVQSSAQNESHSQLDQNINIQKSITEHQPEYANKEVQQNNEIETNTETYYKQTDMLMKEISIPDRLYNLPTKGLERANELINTTYCPISFLNAFIRVLLPIGIVLSLISVISAYSNVFYSYNYSSDTYTVLTFAIMLDTLQVLLRILSWVYLRKYNYTGYILLFVSWYINLVIGLIQFNNIISSLGYFIPFFVANIIFTIYWEKRRFLFTEKAEFPIFKAKSKYNIKIYATQEMKIRIFILNSGYCLIYVIRVLASL